MLDSNYDFDGYHLARHLDNQGWTPDADLVDILSNTDQYFFAALRQAELEWIKTNNITPKFKIGDNVVYVGSNEFSNKKVSGSGEITRINDDGYYTVRGINGEVARKEPGNWIIAWERCS